jgi:hypothetical protein
MENLLLFRFKTAKHPGDYSIKMFKIVCCCKKTEFVLHKMWRICRSVILGQIQLHT